MMKQLQQYGYRCYALNMFTNVVTREFFVDLNFKRGSNSERIGGRLCILLLLKGQKLRCKTDQ